MKKSFSILLMMSLFLTFVSAANAADNGDGFRSALKQTSFQEVVVGGQGKIKIPGSSYIHSIQGKILPEFFINIGSVGGATFDGGVILNGTQWEAVIFGGAEGASVWKAVNINSITGQTIDLKLVGENVNGSFEVGLYINGSRVVSVNENTNTSQGGKLGWLARDPYYSGVWTLSYELNMVPVEAYAGIRYHTLTDSSGKRAFFDGAELTNALPVKKAGGTLNLSQFKWSSVKNCDDPQYSQLEVDKLVYNVSNQTYLYTSINFNSLS